MGNENSVYEFTEDPQANGKLQNGEANGHAIRIVSEGNSANVDAQFTSQSTSQPCKQEKVPSESCKPEGSQKQAGNSRPADTPGNPTQQLEPRKEEEVAPTKAPGQDSDRKRTRGTPRQATFSLFKSVSPPAEAPGNPAQQPAPKEEEVSVQPPPVADKEVEPKQDTEEKVPLFNKLFKKKAEAKIEVDLPVVETDSSQGEEKPVAVTVKENGLYCEVAPTKAPGQDSDRKRTRGTPRQATFSLFKSVSPPAEAPGSPAQQPAPKEEEVSVQPPPVADKEVEPKQDTEEKVPLFNKLFKKKAEAKIEVDLPVVETDGSQGEEKPVLVTVKENGLHCEVAPTKAPGQDSDRKRTRGTPRQATFSLFKSVSPPAEAPGSPAQQPAPKEEEVSVQPPPVADKEVEPKQDTEEKVPLFNKLFKKKAEAKIEVDLPVVETDGSQGEEKPVLVTVKENGLHCEVAPTKTPGQDSDRKRTRGTPRQATFSLFKSVSPPAEAPGSPAQQPAPKEEEVSVQPPPVADKEVEPKQDTEEKVPLFNKLFKKKAEAKIEVDLPVVETDGSQGEEKPVAVTVKANGLRCEPGKGEEASAQRPELLGSVLAESKELGVNSINVQPQQAEHGESHRGERPVMNFFKTFASPSKTSKGVSPDVSKDTAKGTKEPESQSKLEKGSAAKTAEPPASEPKDTDPNPKDSTGGTFSKLFRQKSFKDTQPTATSEVDAATASRSTKTSPPPEPPKAETKAEPAAKNPKNSQKEVPKDAPSGPEIKQKPAKSGPLSKLFQRKTMEEEQQEEEPQEEEGQGGASKASTLEASALPAQTAKPLEKKKSNLITLFKTKTPETTKNTPPDAPPLPEAAQGVKLKEDPKPGTEAEKKRSGKQDLIPKVKALEVGVDSKSVSEASQSGDEAAVSVSKKLEKRNSIHLFFKSLGPKRLSEASVQTDPVTITYPCEKAK
ncbi:breast carcinoma-amplified sequence 1 isoform X2 [Brienomyrus brachyistius]|uniref:breast carcinoma-amplified sequence 1 isoform X2 n=1 Tax=Brienomyrus brachyistius TaxID=42636 RepID=UPI0020B40568|nr:breast carcinoma-amplified sequence 1 isoform X2 [Brienomyrus brachyistius]